MKAKVDISHYDFPTIGKRLKQRRLDFGLSTQEVAEKAGVARYTVIRIENGMPTTWRTLRKIRAVLRIWTDQLVRPASNGVFAAHKAAETRFNVSLSKDEYQKRLVEDDPIHVDDPGERKRLGQLGFQPFFTAVLNSQLPHGMSEQALMELHQSSWVDTHYGEEFVYCLRGRVTITVDGEPCLLEVGDALTFDAQKPHQYAPTDPIGKDDEPALILLVVVKRPKEGLDRA